MPLRMLAILHDFIEIFLELTHLVRDEAERVMQREVLRIRHVLVDIGPQAIQLSDDDFSFDFHAVAFREIFALVNAVDQCLWFGSE